ncbi:unnamed protein product [Hydatigera taeniaeformis]|uniref:RAMA domain-containing protein n=1 Tax=Hydatigena taeniaeformis TaxID=6205 RepID=A0A0R3WPY1_HYDTA|nr:unnamed protein product [Hydatigera taeniaeformis]
MFYSSLTVNINLQYKSNSSDSSASRLGNSSPMEPKDIQRLTLARLIVIGEKVVAAAINKSVSFHGKTPLFGIHPGMKAITKVHIIKSGVVLQTKRQRFKAPTTFRYLQQIGDLGASHRWHSKDNRCRSLKTPLQN